MLYIISQGKLSFMAINVGIFTFSLVLYNSEIFIQIWSQPTTDKLREEESQKTNVSWYCFTYDD